MHRAGFLNLLAARIEKRTPGRPLKVAIDGRCGSGKSTLSDELGVALSGTGLQVLPVSVDAFHQPREHRYRQGEDSARGYYEDAFDYGSVLERLLKPLSGDSFPVLCGESSLDLGADRPIDTKQVSVHPDAVLLFDGVFALSVETQSLLGSENPCGCGCGGRAKPSRSARRRLDESP
jgi:uridine kinase